MEGSISQMNGRVNHHGVSKCRLIVQGSFAPPKLLGMGIMAKCHAGSASNEKNPGWLFDIGDEILPSYIGIIISHYKDPY